MRDFFTLEPLGGIDAGGEVRQFVAEEFGEFVLVGFDQVRAAADGDFQGIAAGVGGDFGTATLEQGEDFLEKIGADADGQASCEDEPTVGFDELAEFFLELLELGEGRFETGEIDVGGFAGRFIDDLDAGAGFAGDPDELVADVFAFEEIVKTRGFSFPRNPVAVLARPKPPSMEETLMPLPPAWR